MKNQQANIISAFVIFFVILGELLFPYAINNLTSISAKIVTIISFFSLTLISYILGKKARENKVSLYRITLYCLIFNLIYSLINPSGFLLEPLYTTKILLCFVIWSLVSKIFNKIIYIPIFLIISLLIGFYEINEFLSYLIALFPFFLIGYNIDFKIKWKDTTKKIIGLILFLFLIIAIIFILKRFYVSFDILLLKPYLTRKHLIFRFGYFSIAILMIIALSLIFDKKPKFLEIYGKNIITTYALLPIFILIFNSIVNIRFYSNYYILYAIIYSFFIIFLTGSKIIESYIITIFKKLENKKLVTIGLLLLTVLALALPKLKPNYINYPIYEEISQKEQEKLDNSISISFVGDLILLENQVKNAGTICGYNFDKMFEYTKKHLSSSDYAIGVLEGPVAKGEYTVGNFNDGAALYLNYPTSFLTSIKNSGIDLVTTANNHILDKAITGARETVVALEQEGLDYVGSFDNKHRIVDIEGLKVGILAYTYETNYYTEDELIESNVTSVIVDPSSKNFNKVKKSVENDFKTIKDLGVDLIIVLPHMGTQFSHTTDVFQNTWNKIFTDLGATVIFGDHSHAVQPIEYIDDTIIINSPGNYVNQYIDYDGDATSIVEVYIDKSTKKVNASSIIPMYTLSNNNSLYTALPIYDIMSNEKLYNSFSSYEMKRIKEVHSLITNTMINTDINIDNIEERYYYFKDGYKRNNTIPITVNDYKETALYHKLKKANSVCFIGDSVTAGTMNGGYGWYEPLINNFNIEVKQVAYGSYTTKLLLENKRDEIKNCNADLYIFAIGTNDIRYRDSSCALTKEEYITNLKKIIFLTKENSEYVFIAPWLSLNNDTVTNLKVEEKEQLFNEYSDALKQFSTENNYLYINPNPLIKEVLSTKSSNYYMKDFIHPNKTNGINLYSWAVLEANKK